MRLTREERSFQKKELKHQTVREYLIDRGIDVKKNIVDLVGIGGKDERNGETRDFKGDGYNYREGE